MAEAGLAADDRGRFAAVTSPAATALATLLGYEPADVERCYVSKAGPYVVRVTSAAATRAEKRAAAEHVAALVSATGAVARIVTVPPNVFVTPEPEFLRAAVVDAARRAGPGYGAALVPRGKWFTCFSSPNPNKPLHIGHLRNNFLGMALAEILTACGAQVERHSVSSDYGVHICQAVVAYQQRPAGAQSERMDRLIGRHYVEFHRRVRDNGDPDLERAAADMMRGMEAGDEALWQLSRSVTRGVEEAIEQTYLRIGTRIDRQIRESEHVARAKEMVEEALASGRCVRRDDGSVYVPLNREKFDELTIERRDGTPLIYRQWMALNIDRFHDDVERGLILTGAEWEAGFAAMVAAHRRLGHAFADRIEAVHFGMVRLPEGRVKSRFGSGPSADDILDALAERIARAWPPAGGALPASAAETCDRLAVALLKLHLLRAARLRDIVYQDDDLWDSAWPLLRGALATLAWAEDHARSGAGGPAAREVDLLLHVDLFPQVVLRAGDYRDPSYVVRFLADLVRKVSALRRSGPVSAEVAQAVAIVCRRCFALLSIDVTGLAEPDVTAAFARAPADSECTPLPVS